MWVGGWVEKTTPLTYSTLCSFRKKIRSLSQRSRQTSLRDGKLIPNHSSWLLITFSFSDKSGIAFLFSALTRIVRIGFSKQFNVRACLRELFIYNFYSRRRLSQKVLAEENSETHFFCENSIQLISSSSKSILSCERKKRKRQGSNISIHSFILSCSPPSLSTKTADCLWIEKKNMSRTLLIRSS